MPQAKAQGTPGGSAFASYPIMKKTMIILTCDSAMLLGPARCASVPESTANRETSSQRSPSHRRRGGDRHSTSIRQVHRHRNCNTRTVPRSRPPPQQVWCCRHHGRRWTWMPSGRPLSFQRFRRARALRLLRRSVNTLARTAPPLDLLPVCLETQQPCTRAVISPASRAMWAAPWGDWQRRLRQ